MADKATGADVKAALVKAAAWDTAVACGAGDGLLIRPHSIKESGGNNIDDSIGTGFPDAADPDVRNCSGDLPMYLRYDSIDLAIALAMGATGGAPAQQEATAAHLQTFTLADTLNGLFATFAALNAVDVEEFPSMKILGFTIKGETGKPNTITFQTLANMREEASAVNTDATFANVTFLDTAHRVLMAQGVFRINDKTGIALADGDKVYPKSWELSFKRKLEGTHASGGGVDTIDEPVNVGQPEITLKLEFPKYGAADQQNFTDWKANTRKKMDIVFTGALIETTHYRQFTAQFPHLVLKDVNTPHEDGIMPHSLEFDVIGTDTAPTGMAINKPFQIDIINTKTTDVLA